MDLKQGALALLAIGLLVLIVVALIPEQAPAAPQAVNGTSRLLEFGRAGDYGYATFAYNGSGSVTLISLSEPPKTQIVVLKQDYLNTERYSYFMDALRALEKKGFSISEVDSLASPNNSIIIIPSGAMPSEILERLDNLTASNRVIYIGKRDLVYSGNLVQEDWSANLSNATSGNLIIIEKTLDEFYSERNYTLLDSIAGNSWAEEESQPFPYSGSGKMTVFIPLRNGSWMRMLPLSDSQYLPRSPVSITGNSEIFPGQRSQLTIGLNYSNGTVSYSLEKGGAILQQGDLDRVRGEEAFFLQLAPNDTGDYLVRIYDHSGTIGAQRLHVKDLNVSLSSAYGNSYEFNVLLDGQPVDGEDASVGLNHSINSVNATVRNGKLVVSANLRQGENIFLVSLMGQQEQVHYSNSQENILIFYAKYLIPGLALIALFYIAMRLNRRPVYRIHVPESAPGKNTEVRLSAKEVLGSIDDVESRFGWKSVPLYAKEVALGLKKLAGGMEVNEGNVEALMKKMEEKGLVSSHLGLYGLSRWGGPEERALKRIIRDKLVANGVDFEEGEHGFDCGEKLLLTAPVDSEKESIIVFEGREERRAYLQALEDRKRAKMELKVRNGLVRLATIDELDELI